MCADELDPDRLCDLYDIGIDEVSWRKQHKYLTLVVDHQRGRVVWGTEGSGGGAADEFFAELDPELAAEHPDAETNEIQPQSLPPAGADTAGTGKDPERRVGERAGRLEAISLDMGPGYAKSARRHAPQAVICIDPYHVVQVRHEALPVRAGCETPTPGCRGSPAKLRAV